VMHSDRMSSANLLIRVTAVVFLAGIGAACAWPADPNPPSIRCDRGAWPLRRQWNPNETDHYAEWVRHIFKMKTEGDIEQRLAKLDRILTDPAMNLLLHDDFLGPSGNPDMPRTIIRRASASLDCAKLTAFLPAYYAYRRALPWMVTFVRSGGGDIRTSAQNYPTTSVSTLDYGSVEAFFNEAVALFSTGNYRVWLTGPKAELSDTVPVAVDRRYLKPGCVNYLDGHSLVLGDVSPYGELCFLNASTTPTHDIYTYNGMNVVAGITPAGEDDAARYEGCIQGLRVFRYPVAITDRRGNVTAVRRRTNEEMKEFGFSTEQYEALQELLTSHYIDVGQLKPETFHDYIRLQMKSVDRIVPMDFMRSYVESLVEVYRLREEFVQNAWQNVLKEGPIVYPEDRRDENIFQAEGRWETWSSPSSDVDRRNKYFYLADWMDYAVRCFGMMPSFVDLTGLEQYPIKSQADLARALIEEKRRLFARHGIEYTNSQGEKVQLTLLQIEDRIYDMSFDPNHPPELRWGAPAGSKERASAPSRATPLPDGTRVPMEEAYALESYYRSVCRREIESSLLRGMFTKGFTKRKSFDAQLSKWFFSESPTDAIVAWRQDQPDRQAEAAMSSDSADNRSLRNTGSFFSPWRE
jgi:hypothetical protein